MSRFPVLRSTAAVATAALTSVFLVAAPGTAAPKQKSPSYVAAANGVMGVAQTIQVAAPRFANRSIGVTVSGAGTQAPVSVTLDGSGVGSFSWTPTASGTWQAQGTGAFAVATGSSFFVSAVPTRTTLFAANQAQAGLSTGLVATVVATAGSLTPVGSVTFSNQFGGTIGSAQLVPGANGTSTATFGWTPASVGLYPIVATYNPTLGAGGFANAGSSSDVDTVEVVQFQPAMTLRLPSTLRLGSPTTVTALIANATQSGSASFTTDVNGTVTGFSGSVPAANGSSQASWTPAALGNQILAANFSASNSNASAVAQQIVSVRPALTKDPISAGPSGQGAWPAGGTITMAPKARVAIAATAQSGSPLSISSAGGCVVIASTLIAPSTPGTCTLTITSPGSSAFAANTATYSVTVARS